MTLPLATTRRAGPWHRRVGGLHVLKVQGDFYEMGYQHGRLLADDVARGPLPYYRTYLERLFRSAALGPAGRLLLPLVQRMVGRSIARGLPGFARDTLRGLADGAGLSWREVLDGATVPDSLVWGASALIRLRRVGPALPYRAGLGLGCTSAIAWGEATADGALLHARNLDYHGVEPWPRTAAVVFHEPADGMRYVAVSAAGVPLGGVTAMNEAGLTLAVHQHMFTDAAALGGTPIGLVGDEVMRHADSLDEAERILRRYRPIGCWTYLVADGRRRELLCYEESPRRRVAHRIPTSAGSFGYANVYLDPELGRTERNLYGSYWRHNAGRHRRVRELLAAGRGRLDPQGMARILGDVGEGPCRLREAIAMLFTVGSVVFRPEDGTFWIGDGPAPTSHARFRAFSLEREDCVPEAEGFDGVPAGLDAAARAAFEAYREAYVAANDRDDPVGARTFLAEARRLAPDQPLYAYVDGLLALGAGEVEAAREAFERAIELGHPDAERRAAFRFWRARALDLAGRREEALGDYRAALEGPSDPPLEKAARRHLSRPCRARDLRALNVDFAFADVVAP
ncbi:MAG: hypothetical protein D6731_25875 [Planctomycetota bacterium]|nr:MAG: hypothetical protein D6731_25875 [Planctomycetota bacterium]